MLCQKSKPGGFGAKIVCFCSKLRGIRDQYGNTCCGVSSSDVQINLNLRNYDLRKNLDLRKIVTTTDSLVHKLFDLRKIF